MRRADDLDAKLQAKAGGPPLAAARVAKPLARGDRWAMLNTVTDNTLRDLGDAELRVWLILFRDVRDGVARTGMGDIARRAGLTRRGVVKAVGRLKARGLIVVTARGTVGGKPNSYRLKNPDLVNHRSLP